MQFSQNLYDKMQYFKSIFEIMCNIKTKNKGFEMKIMKKNIDTLLEKFESALERWADILF